MWRRESWAPSSQAKSRVFQTYAGARAFYERLTTDDGRGYSRAIVRVHRREVGAWVPLTPR